MKDKGELEGAKEDRIVRFEYLTVAACIYQSHLCFK